MYVRIFFLSYCEHMHRYDVMAYAFSILIFWTNNYTHIYHTISFCYFSFLSEIFRCGILSCIEYECKINRNVQTYLFGFNRNVFVSGIYPQIVLDYIFRRKERTNERTNKRVYLFLFSLVCNRRIHSYYFHNIFQIS